jgi:hypothetical protein
MANVIEEQNLIPNFSIACTHAAKFKKKLSTENETDMRNFYTALCTCDFELIFSRFTTAD